MGIFNHREHIVRFHQHWKKKPALRMIYHGFYRLLSENLSNLPDKTVVELGSGIGSIKDVIPECITTDTFPTPWNDKVENAYQLSFPDETVSDLILFDVFHHLEYPGTALKEFFRVLKPGGRVLLFEPCLSLIGLITYGLFHHEPIGLNRKIEWSTSHDLNLENVKFYAAQGNAFRVFQRKNYSNELKIWTKIMISRLSAISYLASGGYSKHQLVPVAIIPLLQKFESFFDLFPLLFATRMLIVLIK